MIKKIILIFILWHLILIVPLLVANQKLHFRKGYEYTLLQYFIKQENPISHFLLSPWANFDGVYYLLIAAKGYTVNPGFFPLFPLSIRIATLPFGNLLAFDPTQYLIAIILASTYFILSLFVLYKLILLDFHKNIAIKSIIFMLLFPTSFFFAAIYSESLFLLLLVCALYFSRKRKWFFAAIFGMLLTATRLVGIAILPSILYEFLTQEHVITKLKHLEKQTILSISYLLFIPLGLLSYIIYNIVRWGNALYFIQAQGGFKNNRSVSSIVLFPQTIFRYAKILTSVTTSHFEWWIALLELGVFVFAAIFLYIAWKKKIRSSYILFSLVCFLVPISSGTFTGLPRYVLVLFPLFMALALVKSKTVAIIYAVIGFVLLFLLFALFSKGYYIA